MPAGRPSRGCSGDYSNIAPRRRRSSTRTPTTARPTQIMRSPTPIRARSTRTSTPSCSAPSTRRRTTTHDLDKHAGAVQRARRTARTPSMAGFVADYVDKFRARARHASRRPTSTDADHGLVLARHAAGAVDARPRSFAVYDHWHCAVPSQTFCNRSFFHASTSHGFVTNGANGGYGKWLDAKRNKAPTIFNRLQDAGVDWAVYYDDRQLISLTGLHARARSWSRTGRRTSTPCRTFYEQAANGNLPGLRVHRAAAALRPQRHAPAGRCGDRGRRRRERHHRTRRSRMSAPATRCCTSVYSAIRTSASPTGSNALNTAAAGHVRRARRHLRPRPAAGRDAAARDWTTPRWASASTGSACACRRC